MDFRGRVIVLFALTACGGRHDEAADGGDETSDGTDEQGEVGETGSETGEEDTGGPNPGCDPKQEPPVGFFVAVDGEPDATGAEDDPWDLATALAHPSGVVPGDTIWLRGGRYEGSWVSKLVGEADAPITVRSYPGEWALIDGGGSSEVALQVYKQHTIFRDFEVTNSDPMRVGTSRPSGIYVEGTELKFIDLVVHDVGTGIIGNSGADGEAELAPETEVYGCIFYNNGWDEDDRSHGHHVYLQNHTGTKTIADNLLFNSFGFGIHLYSETDSNWIEGYEIVGNVWWQAGVASSVVEEGEGQSKLYDDCLVGHNGSLPVGRVRLAENLGWAKGPGERSVRLGWGAPQNEDATVVDNYLVGQLILQEAWAEIAMTGNTVFGGLQGADPADFPDNTWLDQAPTKTEVFVRQSAHSAGRAHVVVFNWEDLDEVDVDLGAVLEVGAGYEVRNAQDYLAAPIVEGVFEGDPVALPLDGLSVAQPIGLPDAIHPDELPGRAFAVFVVVGASCP